MKRVVVNIVLVSIIIFATAQCRVFAENEVSVETTRGILSPAKTLEKNLCYLERIDMDRRHALTLADSTYQLSLMTNMIDSASNLRNIRREDADSRLALVKWSLALPAVRSNDAAIRYCAYAISNIEPVSTNAYQEELMAATEADMKVNGNVPRTPGVFVKGRAFGPARINFEKKWRPILDQNRQIVSLRNKSIRALSHTIGEYFRTGSTNGCCVSSEVLLRGTRFNEEERKTILRMTTVLGGR